MQATARRPQKSVRLETRTNQFSIQGFLRFFTLRGVKENQVSIEYHVAHTKGDFAHLIALFQDLQVKNLRPIRACISVGGGAQRGGAGGRYKS